MDWLPFITQSFDYDRWANRQWLNSLGGFKNLSRAHEILEHILAAQQTWLKRCGVDVPPQEGDSSLQDLFDVTAMTWVMVLEQTDPNEIISYTTTRGEQYAQPLAQIALHVVNHGTYHRGQLRGLAEADGFSTFPETDLIFFFREEAGPALPHQQTSGKPLHN
jgi:uncharacterized damage-inducible protein DinB